jgi:SAM-dependent methyltransferase
MRIDVDRHGRIEMETVACDLCGANDTTALYAWDDWGEPRLPGAFLVACQRCGLMYLNPRPDQNEIGAYYPPEYSPYRPAIEDEHFALMRWVRRRKLVVRRQLIERYSGAQTGRLLDVGCATGLFLHEMALAGWNALGVEPSPQAATYAHERTGLEVFQGWLGDAPFEPASFDVVTYWDVLEHTFSPSAELARCVRLLKPGGLLAINVPNWDSVERRVFGPYWNGFDPPRHLYTFTRPVLTALLTQAALRPLAWTCFMPSYFSFIISLDRWLKVRRPAWAAPVRRVLNFPSIRFLFEPWFWACNRLGQGGVIAVFAQKD